MFTSFISQKPIDVNVFKFMISEMQMAEKKLKLFSKKTGLGRPVFKREGTRYRYTVTLNGKQARGSSGENLIQGKNKACQAWLDTHAGLEEEIEIDRGREQETEFQRQVMTREGSGMLPDYNLDDENTVVPEFGSTNIVSSRIISETSSQGQATLSTTHPGRENRCQSQTDSETGDDEEKIDHNSVMNLLSSSVNDKDDEKFDKLDKDIKKNEVKHLKRMEELEEQRQLLEQSFCETKIREKENTDRKSRLNKEITKEVMREKFYERRDYLQAIMDGNVASPRHMAFKKNKHLILMSLSILHPFSDEQYDFLWEIMKEEWVGPEMNSYIQKVCMLAIDKCKLLMDAMFS